MLNVVSVVDVPFPFVLHICSHGVKDVVAHASTNKVADHANITMDIATLVEKILYEDGSKTMDSDVIADMAEDAVDGAFVHVMVKNDNGHATNEKIVATSNENVVEHVLHTTTHEWNPIMK